VLVSLWGYGDLVGDWYGEPSEFYRQQPLVSRDEAFAGVSGAAVENGDKNSKERSRFYLYCRQQGVWPELVGGWDPETEADKFLPYLPVRNVTAEYPPTILVHGTEDTDVPYDQSVEMARELKRAGVAHEFVSVPGAGHGLSPGDKVLVKDAYDRVFSFVDRVMSK
jgi:dipeptidyl aminopeptidase/acylaminoacyl peptidase